MSLPSQQNSVGVQQDLTQCSRAELASEVTRAVREMDRLEEIEQPAGEYEAGEAHLLARLDSMAGNG